MSRCFNYCAAEPHVSIAI